MLNVLIKKTGKSVAVDFDKLPQSSKDYLIQYGLKQRLNDCHSAVKKGKTEEVMAAVEKALAALVSGEVRVNRAGSAWETEMLRRVALATKMKVKDLKEALESSDKDILEVFSSYCQKTGTTVESEQNAFESARKVQSINLDDIGLGIEEASASE